MENSNKHNMASSNKTFNNKGADYLNLIPHKLSVDEISDSVKDPSSGAISMFIGTTRNNFNDLKVVSLQYEAYESMAIKVMKDICNNLRETWPDIINIAIHHRLGNVPVCEASVIIAISSPHRQTSLSSVECAINKLKELVPIWKKEEYENPNAEAKWKENSESCDEIDETRFIPDSSMIQINSSHDEVFSRINDFMAYRKSLNNKDNIRTFCKRNAQVIAESSCSRIDATGHRNITTRAEQQYLKEFYDETEEKKQENKKKIKNYKEKFNSKSRDLESHENESREHEAFDLLKRSSSLSSEQYEKPKYLLEQSHYNIKPLESDNAIPFGLRERLLLVEDHISVNAAPSSDVFERMKYVEDKIIDIENNCEKYIKAKNYFRKYQGISMQSHVPSSSSKAKQNDQNKSQSAKLKVFSIEDIEKKIMNLKRNLINNEFSSDEENNS